MAKFNMCNRFDQVTGGLVIYSGTVFNEYEDLEQPKPKEPEKKPFSAAAVVGNVLGAIAVGVVVGAAIGFVAVAGILTGGLAWVVGGMIAGAIAGSVAANAISQGIDDCKENKTTSATEYLSKAFSDAMKTGGQVMDVLDKIFFVKGMVKNIGKNLLKSAFKNGSRKAVKIPKLKPPNPKPPKAKPTQVAYGDHYASKRPKKLKSNVEYTDSNGYTYTTDAKGRITDVDASIKTVDPSTKRNPYAQRNVGRGEGRLPDDDGGHLIGTQFKGSKDIDNLLPQNSNLNKGKWKTMENKWRDAVNDGKNVDVKIKVNYDKDRRPTNYKVNYKIEGEDWKKNIFPNKSLK